ncbi:MAG: hypothetical protein LBI43_01210 [Streptococcaceae bacterium]|jgi:hypothetical protein|nr:hypothetical protein [Streptococcaceae bacterium]
MKKTILKMVIALTLVLGIGGVADVKAHAAYIGTTNVVRVDKYKMDNNGNYTVYVPGSEKWLNPVQVNCLHGFYLILARSCGVVSNHIDTVTYYYSVQTY